MRLPPLNKSEALRLECARIAGDETIARQLYEFIIEKPKAVRKSAKKPRVKS